MSIDLWGDTAPPRTDKAIEALSVPEEGKEVKLIMNGATITMVSKVQLSRKQDYPALLLVEEEKRESTFVYTLPLRALNAYVLRHLLKNHSVEITPQDARKLTVEADKIAAPAATLADNGKHIEVTVPALELYKGMLRTVNAYPVKSGIYKVALARALDLETLNKEAKTALPPIKFSQEVTELNTASLPGFDGTMESLKTISIGELNVVKANSQSYKAVAKSKKSLEEKMEAFGIKTIFDLITWLPKKYIDKSAPQDIRDLIPDESATIIGTVTQVSDLPNNMGVVFTVETASGNDIRVSFWRQHWLKNKFRVGSEVLVTGKFIIWNRRPQLNGTSIEYSKEASMLPIVPVYKQSESRGITTAFILSAIREAFSRLGPISLPSYLKGDGRIDYYEAYRELHLPTDLEHHKKVIDSLAYYELVAMQLIIQSQKEKSLQMPGLEQAAGPRCLQEKAIATLPWKLTESQERAVARLNDKMEDGIPSSTLLNADTGSGKTLVAQLACLRSVEAGYQAVLLGPTDVLARQLYSTFARLGKALEEAGEKVTIAYMSGGLKAAEKRALLKAIKEGEVDIVVGTHSVMSAAVEYANLGFVAIDEQQKFGAQQRTQLLSSRPDGKIPDLLMQTATPIPRSTAQVFYGDVDMLLLKDKPPGRLPIVTKWVREDPQEIIAQAVNPMWADVQEEADKGNQTFVITPMVRDSTSIDAASVERSYKHLSEAIFPHLKVGFVHGQMKTAEQQEVMEAFREKRFDILVASTVVEVGVDIPDATRMVVLSADRMGASSLHQIRGRVGRNSKPSICYLVSLGHTENSVLRLQSLVDSEDGFEVAKADLFVRGEGTMFGGDQSGASDMMFASLSRHGKWVKYAKDEAIAILSSPAREQALQDSKKHFEAEGRLI